MTNTCSIMEAWRTQTGSTIVLPARSAGPVRSARWGWCGGCGWCGRCGWAAGAVAMVGDLAGRVQPRPGPRAAPARAAGVRRRCSGRHGAAAGHHGRRSARPPGVTGATSLALALAAGASQAGSWVAAVGLGSLGLVAAAELGVALDRLVLVADPGRERTGWASVVAALVDGFDVVLVAAGHWRAERGPAPGRAGWPGRRAGVRGGGSGGDRGRVGPVGPVAAWRGRSGGGRLRAGDARRLVARVRGSLLAAVGGDLPGERSSLRLAVTASPGRGWARAGGTCGPGGWWSRPRAGVRRLAAGGPSCGSPTPTAP